MTMYISSSDIDVMLCDAFSRMRADIGCEDGGIAPDELCQWSQLCEDVSQQLESFLNKLAVFRRPELGPDGRFIFHGDVYQLQVSKAPGTKDNDKIVVFDLSSGEYNKVVGAVKYRDEVLSGTVPDIILYMINKYNNRGE